MTCAKMQHNDDSHINPLICYGMWLDFNQHCVTSTNTTEMPSVSYSWHLSSVIQKICSGMSLNTMRHGATSSDMKRQCASVRGITLLSILITCYILLSILVSSARDNDILHYKFKKFALECYSIPGNMVRHQAVWSDLACQYAALCYCLF